MFSRKNSNARSAALARAAKLIQEARLVEIFDRPDFGVIGMGDQIGPRFEIPQERNERTLVQV